MNYWQPEVGNTKRSCCQTEGSSMKIGVLASQGAFIEHIAVLRQLGVETVHVRLPRDLGGLDGLIIPGGERTA